MLCTEFCDAAAALLKRPRGRGGGRRGRVGVGLEGEWRRARGRGIIKVNFQGKCNFVFQN